MIIVANGGLIIWDVSNLYIQKRLEIVTNFGDEDLNSALESLDGRLCSIKEFWQDFENIYTKHIPITLVNCIEQNFVCNAFIEKVYPKLKIYEENTWDEIRLYSHRRGQDSVSNNHYVSIQKLNKEAQDRLVELGYSDRSEIYSLRLEGKIRIYGFREMNFWGSPKTRLCSFSRFQYYAHNLDSLNKKNGMSATPLN